MESRGHGGEGGIGIRQSGVQCWEPADSGVVQGGR